VDDGWSKKFMLRERVAPDHICILSKVLPKDLLDLKGLKVTTSRCAQKQMRGFGIHLGSGLSGLATAEAIERNAAERNKFSVVGVEIGEDTASL
jgi:hypothetical protein